jgi:bifunctional non-homologous end joining protein LigD
MCEAGIVSMVPGRVNARSRGRRGASWIKVECIQRQKFLVIGRTGRSADNFMAEPSAAPARSGVSISHGDRVIFPDPGITKGDLAGYYEAMAGPMLATMAERPLALTRCPEGIGAECFFQKHGAAKIGKAVRSAMVPGKGGKQLECIHVDDATGLVECVQMGTVEFHGWASLLGTVEQPDRMVFDLDPDTAIGFDSVREAAGELRERLAAMGLTSFAMLTGGKGVHVIVPLTPGAGWPAFTGFARRFAEAMAAARPDRYVATMAKTKRKGRIFIDWMRNQRGSTAIMPWSVRARPGAPVAAPVAWNELGGIASASRYGLMDLAELAERSAGPLLAGWGTADQVLPET